MEERTNYKVVQNGVKNLKLPLGFEFELPDQVLHIEYEYTNDRAVM